jgi:hypothetical protein
MPGLSAAGAHSFAPLAEGDAAPGPFACWHVRMRRVHRTMLRPNARLDEWAP